MLKLNSMNKQVSFSQHDEIKDYSDDCKEKESKKPSFKNQNRTSSVRLINMLPIDFIRLWSFSDFNFGFDFQVRRWRTTKILSKVISFFFLLLKHLKDLTFVVFRI